MATSPRRASSWRSPGPPFTTGSSIAVAPGALRRRVRRADREDPRQAPGHLWRAPGARPAAPRRRARGAQAGGTDHGARGLVGRCKRRWKKTTIADPDAEAAVDLLKRVFGPGTVEFDRVYVGDITYVWTWEGWAYLATVIDLASRRVVGWAIADHMEASLVCDAMNMLTIS